MRSSVEPREADERIETSVRDVLNVLIVLSPVVVAIKIVSLHLNELTLLLRQYMKLSR